MPVVSRLARPLLSSIFVNAGIGHLRHPEIVAGLAEPVTTRLAGTIPGLPKDAATQVRINAVAQIVGGLLLNSRRWRRVGAALLIGSLIPTTLAGHAFWNEDDPTNRMMAKSHFMKNLAIFGGLLLALVDREGKPSLGWRAKRKAEAAGAAVAASRLPIG